MTANFNDFKQALRDYVIADETVLWLIDTRFYGAQLATIFDPVYPNAVFFAESGDLPIASIVFRFLLNIRAYSEKSFDEAHNVYKAIADLLDSALVPTRIIIRPVTVPVEHQDQITRTYGVYGKFHVTWLP